MSEYYYLDVSLIFHNLTPYEITPAYIKKNILEALKSLFGECGSAVPVDLLRCDLKERRFTLRVLRSHYVKLRSSLTLSGRRLGPNNKDVVIFATKEDHQVPSKIKLPEPDPQPGLILPNGEINWNCPCLGGMATGPCGVEFRNAFSCFHYSDAEPKGSDCYDLFKTMQTCMQKYPTLYNKDIADEDDISTLNAAEEPKDAKSEMTKKSD